MNTRHIDTVPGDRRAIAPYNFVELPEKVVAAELPLPEGDRYHPKLHTGRIECTLTTESPLYIRCGMIPSDFIKYSEMPEKYLKPPKNGTEKQKKQWEEEKKQWETERKTVLAPFFTYRSDLLPVLPGSSLRGMLRTLVEIVSFSKIDRVSDQHRLFFRAVASNPDKESWGKEYKNYVEPKKVKAGYLKKDAQGCWYIQPAIRDRGVTFAWVQEDELTSITGFKKFDDKHYEPQYFNVSYQSLEEREVRRNGKVIAKLWFAQNIHLQQSEPSSKLVTSGNMKQREDESSPRCNHCVVFVENKNTHPLQIDDKAIDHYRNALTNFQKQSPFNKDWGVLEEHRPVFYSDPGNVNIVNFFGQSPNFRIPYSPEGNGHTTTVVDFIPKIVHNPYVINWNNAPIKFSVILLSINFLVGILFVAIPLVDLADAIFGWVKQETKDKKLPEKFDKQRAGRVFVTDAIYESSKNDIWYEKEALTPQILSEPKPSYFPHYLVQPNVDKLELKHYASQPITETVIRGHKLYWHKGSDSDFKLPPPKKVIGSTKKVKVSDTQTTLIKPINKGVTFKFDIYFENLSQVELGTLLWVLDIAQDERYRLKLGMGKPLGLGAVKIEPTLYLSSRKQRYQDLSDSNNCWEKGEIERNKDISDYVSKFETYMLEQLNHTKDFKNLCRVQMLLAMLSWSGLEDVENKSRYMEIERKKIPRIGNDKNEYKERPILPDPLDVMREVVGIKIECDRPSLFSEGQEVEAKVVDIKVKEGKKLKTTITYQIEGSDCLAKEELYKHTISLAINDLVKVTIVKNKGESIRTVKLIQ